MTYVIAPDGGLCNRIRVLLSWLKKARADGQQLVVYWPITVHCNGSFIRCFESIPGVHVLQREPEPGRRLDYRGWDACGPLEISALRPSQTIKERIELIRATLGSEYDAVHIRRTDLPAERDGNYIPDSEFEQFIADAADAPVYLATDNAATQRHFLETFSPAKIRIATKITDRDGSLRQTPLDIAVIDLFMCAGATYFKGTVGSSFTEMIETMRSHSSSSSESWASASIDEPVQRPT
jgi:hypothetical protein